MSKPKVIIFNSIGLDGRLENNIDLGLYYGLAATWTQIEPYSGCAMLSGSETILAGYAEKETEPFEPPQEPKQTIPGAVPFLVVIDSRGRIQNWVRLQAEPYWEQAVAVFSQSTPQTAVDEAKRAGVQVIVTGTDRVDLAAALEHLSDQFGIHTVRVDSGGRLNSALLQAGLVDEVSVLLCGTLPGQNASLAFSAPETSGAEHLVKLNLFHCEKVQDNIVWLRYEVDK